MALEKTIGNYLFSDDKSKLQLNVIHDFLSKESYWAKNIPLKLVEQTISGSVCFGIYHNSNQVGFARVITDHASFGYLADVFVLKEHRSKGLSKQLMDFILGYENFKNFRRFMLATRDAQALYAQCGFKALADPSRIMEIKPFESYPDTI